MIRRWLERWRHSRHAKLRRIDLDCMFVAIVDRSKSLADCIIAWEVFVTMPGQEHWQCDCALHARGQIASSFNRLLRVKVQP